MTSGYSPIGAMIASDRLMEPFLQGNNMFAHGFTFGGHPVSAAVALANLDIFEREGLNGHVRDNEAAFRPTLEKLHDLPIVGDVRGDGYFYGIELVKDKATRETFDDDESERLLRGFLSKALFDAGLYCRADDRGDPVMQLAPPLICDQAHFDEIEQILRVGADRGMDPALSRGHATDARPTGPAAAREAGPRPGRPRRGPRRRPGRPRGGRRRRRAARTSCPVGLRPRRRPGAVHGSTGSRLFRPLAAGAPTCLTVTLLDGLVLARSRRSSPRCTTGARWCSAPRDRCSTTDKLRALERAHRAPAARPLGGRPARRPRRSSPRRWCSRCRSTSGR